MLAAPCSHSAQVSVVAQPCRKTQSRMLYHTWYFQQKKSSPPSRTFCVNHASTAVGRTA